MTADQVDAVLHAYGRYGDAFDGARYPGDPSTFASRRRAADEARRLAALELDRWADDGGPDPVLPTRPLAPMRLELRIDLTAWSAAVTAGMQAFGQLVDMFGADWRNNPRPFYDVDYRRWRDRPASSERPIDRARRLDAERFTRDRARREARRRSKRARKAAPWRQVAAAGRHGRQALEVLCTAAAEARAEHDRLDSATYALTELAALHVNRPAAGLIITTVQP